MQLDEEKKSPMLRHTPLNELLSSYSSFTMEETSPSYIDKSYTLVQLEELSDTHIGQLADRVELRKYILRNLPIDFADDFEHKGKISKALRANVPGYNAVIIRLEVDNAPIEVISRPAIPNLDDPQMDFIRNSKKEPIAYYWSCLHAPGGQISDTYKDYQGFVYKVKGFTIGDNEKLRGDSFKIGSGTLYKWYTGEIYVLDPNVIPNAARDDFEANRAKVQLVTAVQDKLNDLQKQASQHQQRLKAEKTIRECTQQLDQIEAKITLGQYYDNYDEHSQLNEIIKELEKQKKSGDKQTIQSLIQRAEKLKKIVRKAIDNIEEPIKRPAPTPEVAPPSSGLYDNPLQTHIGQSIDADDKPYEQRPDTSQQQQIVDRSASRTLMALLNDLGIEVGQETIDFIQMFDAALADVLGYQSRTYKQVLENIEARIEGE